MKQVVQEIRSGVTAVRELPEPMASPGAVIVANVASLVSAGTEKYVVDLAKKNLFEKARARPDHVRRVMQKVGQEGLRSTLTQVLAKLDEPMTLGYSSAGVVIECGRGVQEFKPGDRVAVAAPHAGIVSVGRNLCVKVPDNVTFEQAAYAGVGAIALQGVRLAKVSLGDRVLVIGLGLIGQIVVGLLKAQGCRVFGTDVDPARLEQARTFGADEVALGSPRDAVMAFSASHGVDAVLITAATSSNEPIEFAADAARPKGRIVLVGVVGLTLPRPPFFSKELEFTVSASLGAGRWDPVYEEKGVDYPIGHARWTVQRNMGAVLETIASGRLSVDRLTSHRFDVSDAAAAYDLMMNGAAPFTGIVINYPPAPAVPVRRLELRSRPARSGSVRLGVIGAGNFARLVLLPILAKSGVTFRGLCTARGLNAENTGRRYGFDYATTDVRQVIDDPETDAVLIATRHDLHAELVIDALRAGKHVFVEKPLCIKRDELVAIDRCVQELGDDCPVLTVGFNRRFAKATGLVKRHFGSAVPLSLTFRFAPGPLPPGSWPQDQEVGGGRIVGEACHAIDLCCAITGSQPVRVFAESVGNTGGLEVTDDRVFITIRHANGSISNISYQAGGDKAGPRERLEVFGDGRTAVVEGWEHVELWSGGKQRCESGGKDKGHTTELHAFLASVQNGGDWPISWEHLYGTTWASLMAVQSLREGQPLALEGSCS